jgi:hypothetical protein
MSDEHAKLCMDSWAGRREIACLIIGETKNRLRIRLEQDCRLPSGRTGVKGREILVPRYAIRRDRIRENQQDMGIEI